MKYQPVRSLVPGGGVEPPRPEGRRILSPFHAFHNIPHNLDLPELCRPPPCVSVRFGVVV
jgi:hypothetical protein